jgi:hypothetical protein
VICPAIKHKRTEPLLLTATGIQPAKLRRRLASAALLFVERWEVVFFHNLFSLDDPETLNRPTHQSILHTPQDSTTNTNTFRRMTTSLDQSTVDRNVWACLPMLHHPLPSL